MSTHPPDHPVPHHADASDPDGATGAPAPRAGSADGASPVTPSDPPAARDDPHAPDAPRSSPDAGTRRASSIENDELGGEAPCQLHRWWDGE